MDEDDNGKLRLERVKTWLFQISQQLKLSVGRERAIFLGPSKFLDCEITHNHQKDWEKMGWKTFGQLNFEQLTLPLNTNMVDDS